MRWPSCFACLPVTTIKMISVEDRRKPALAEDDRRLVVVVAHFGISRGRESDDADLAQSQSLGRSQRAGLRLAGDRSVGFKVLSPAGVERLNEIACFADHWPSF